MARFGREPHSDQETRPHLHCSPVIRSLQTIRNIFGRRSSCALLQPTRIVALAPLRCRSYTVLAVVLAVVLAMAIAIAVAIALGFVVELVQGIPQDLFTNESKPVK